MNPALLGSLDAGADVVTPNRRLARWLHREFDLIQHGRGRRAWATPIIRPYPQWLEGLWSNAVASDAVHDGPILLTPLQSTVQWRRVVDPDVQRLQLFDGRGAATLAAQAWTLVHAWGAGTQPWRAWHSRDGTPDDAAVFAHWADAYAVRLRSIGAHDLEQVADTLAMAAPQVAHTLPATVLAGFDELTPQQERLVSALRARGADIRTQDTLPAIAADVTRVATATPRDEIIAALGWARDRALACPGARIGIVVEDLLARREEVVALAEDVLCPGPPLVDSVRPFEISLGPPLAAVPLVTTALDLITLLGESLPMGSVAALLRSPYIVASENEWAVRARIEREWLALGQPEVTLSETISALDRCSSSLAARWRTARDAARLRRSSSPREWSDAWRAWLVDAGWPGSRALDSDEYQARAAWERLLLEYATLGAVAPRLSPAGAVSSLRALASERRFQPEGGLAPIQILGVLEGAGIAFDALWVAGFTADRWPPAPSPNPLLPMAWQRSRNVARASAQREREYARRSTERFAAAAREVVFSSFAHVDEHASSPSALIVHYPEREIASSAPSWIVEVAHGSNLETIVDHCAPPLPPGSRAPGGSRIVAAQSDCPFQAAARCRLRAEPWPAPWAGLTPLEHGAMLHVAMARFWIDVRDHATLIGLGKDELSRCIRAAVEHALAELSPSRWRALPSLLRDGEAQRLERLIGGWLDVERARPPFTVQALEARAALQLAGLEFSLRLDRIDALAGGGIAIIDYKTGQVDRPKQWFAERPRSAQIGLYALACEAEMPDTLARAATYALLRAEGVAVAGLAADERAWPDLDPVATIAPGGTWESLQAWWRKRLGALASEIATGHAAVSPRSSPSPCSSCGLQPLCRIESVRAFDPDEANDE